MILVIRHVVEKTRYDSNGRVLESKGDIVVSHGVDIDTGKTVILPDEKWSNFAHNCSYIDGEWYLK